MNDLPPNCEAIERPRALFDPATAVHGLRAARAAIVGGQRILDVWLFADPPPELADPGPWHLRPPSDGATVQIDSVAIDGDHLRLALLGLPDLARYRLEVTPPAGVDFDPLRVRLPVRLRPECPDLANCFDAGRIEPSPSPSPVDYTARDWVGLRRALVEFLQRSRPGADTSPADPTITVIELFAHVGDLLHYRLDRVSTELSLATARQRTSVRRHARLLDYPMADAAAARTTIHLSVQPGQPPVLIRVADVARPTERPTLGFTIEEERQVVAALGEIALYDWGESGCCLTAGATSAVLVRPRPADPLGPGWLQPGDKLAFEVIDPGDRADHDAWRNRDPATPWPQVDGGDGFRSPLPSRSAQVVELTAVEPIVDPLAPDLDLALVRWRAQDRLTRSYPVSIATGRGAPEVTVARANLVDAHHGLLVDGEPAATLEELIPDWADNLPEESIDDRSVTGSGTSTGSSRLGWMLTGAPRGLARDVDGRPYLLDVRVTLPSGVEVSVEHVDSHLGLTPGALAVTVEEDDDRPPLLRFRTGSQGTEPPTGSTVSARYEAGGGLEANVAANTLTVLERNTAPVGQVPTLVPIDGVTARNVIPASGGTDPEPLSRVKRGAPQAFAGSPRRAVLAADHAAAARDLPGVDRATAARTWTGAWPLIRAVVDLTGRDELADLDAVKAELDGLRMLGQEVTAVVGTGVGLAVGLEVCVAPGIDTEVVRRSILARLRPGTDEAPGLFHPSNLRLGGTIHMSRVLASAAAVHGVDAVELTMARRLVEPVDTVHETLRFEAEEIPVLDDDPARPERGRLELTMRGGR